MARPMGVTILAVLSFFAAGLTLLVALAALIGGAALGAMAASLPGAIAGAGVVVVAFVCFFFAALYALNGFGLFRLQNWARILTIVLIVLGLLSAGFGTLSALGHFRLLLLIRELIIVGIDVWILLYLFKQHVKQAFGSTGF